MARHRARVYCASISEQFALSEAKAHHLSKVLRLKPGDKFLAFNNIDGEWLCEIVENSKTLTARKLSLNREPILPSNRFALAFCLIKPDNTRLVIEKCTELGVTDFYPLISDYTQLRTANLEKLRTIAEAAVEQSERIELPTIHDISKLSNFLLKLPAEFYWYSAIERYNSDVIQNYKSPPGFIVGPEGGFSPEEKKLLLQKTIPISLGQYILRAETACIKISSTG